MTISLDIYRIKDCPSFRGIVTGGQVTGEVSIAFIGTQDNGSSGCFSIAFNLLERDGALTKEEALVHSNPVIRDLGKLFSEEER